MAGIAPIGRRGNWIRHAAIAAAVACAAGIGAADAGAGTGSRTVEYRGYEIAVPASWPVHRLAANPSTCVRFDRHAVYLGHPGADQGCPAHVVGRSGAVLVEPLPRATPEAGAARELRAPEGRAAPEQLPAARSATELRVDVPSAGVQVTATWRRSPAAVRRILDGARLTPAAKPSRGPARSSRPTRAPATATASASQKGLGFDACTAPSKSAMSAWSSSPYRTAGVYIGGANRGCSQPNLTPSWVRKQVADGWGLIPIYVGLQAPANVCGCAAIKRSEAKSQGRAAARDAIADAQALGLGSGSPIYFDMESYSRTSTNSKAVLRFLSGWTARIRSGGYVAGVYSSAGSGIVDLGSRYGTSYREPDDIWIANWDGRRTTHDSYIPDSYWSDHQRIRQYRGAHNESYGGHTINIDNDYVDGAVAGASDRDGDGTSDELDLCPTVGGLISNSGCPFPSHVTGGLVRYLDSVDGDRREGDHFTTTGAVDPAYSFQANLGYLLNTHLAGTQALYSCTSAHDQFVSRAADCTGAKVLGLIGYAYSRRPPGIPTAAIYQLPPGEDRRAHGLLRPRVQQPRQHQPRPPRVHDLGRLPRPLPRLRRRRPPRGRPLHDHRRRRPRLQLPGQPRLPPQHPPGRHPGPLQLHLRPRPVRLPGGRLHRRQGPGADRLRVLQAPARHPHRGDLQLPPGEDRRAHGLLRPRVQPPRQHQPRPPRVHDLGRLPRPLPRLRRRRPPRGRPLHDHRRRRPRLQLPGQPRLPPQHPPGRHPGPLQLHLRPRPVRLPGGRLHRRQGPGADRLRVREATAAGPDTTPVCVHEPARRAVRLHHAGVQGPLGHQPGAAGLRDAAPVPRLSAGLLSDERDALDPVRAAGVERAIRDEAIVVLPDRAHVKTRLLDGLRVVPAWDRHPRCRRPRARCCGGSSPSGAWH